jgi:hypothetical protein
MKSPIRPINLPVGQPSHVLWRYPNFGILPHNKNYRKTNLSHSFVPLIHPTQKDMN